MATEENIGRLEYFLSEVPDPNSQSFLAFFAKKTEEMREFELKLLELDIEADGLSFISFHIGNERELYDKRAPGYDQRSQAVGRRDLIAKVDEFFTSQISAVFSCCESLTKLDVACGTGERTRRYDDYINSLGIPLHSFGIDLSKGMINRALGNNIKLAEASMTHIPFRDWSFDFVTLLFNSIGHLDYDEFSTAFREVYRIMKHGSLFFLDTHTHHSLDYYANISYPSVQEQERRQRLLNKRLAIKRHLNQQYHVYRVLGTNQLQTNYHFLPDQVLDLGRKVGFNLLYMNQVTEKDLGYRNAGAEMFVYLK